jgi:hypothetical protein
VQAEAEASGLTAQSLAEPGRAKWPLNPTRQDGRTVAASVKSRERIDAGFDRIFNLMEAK